MTLNKLAFSIRMLRIVALSITGLRMKSDIKIRLSIMALNRKTFAIMPLIMALGITRLGMQH